MIAIRSVPRAIQDKTKPSSWMALRVLSGPADDQFSVRSAVAVVSSVPVSSDVEVDGSSIGSEAVVAGAFGKETGRFFGAAFFGAAFFGAAFFGAAFFGAVFFGAAFFAAFLGAAFFTSFFAAFFGAAFFTAFFAAFFLAIAFLGADFFLAGAFLATFFAAFLAVFLGAGFAFFFEGIRQSFGVNDELID